MRYVLMILFTTLLASCSSSLKNEDINIDSSKVKSLKDNKQEGTTKKPVVDLSNQKREHLSIKNLLEKKLGKPQVCSSMAEPTGNKCFKGDIWFSRIDNKNDYAKLFYAGDGYLEYFLFRGTDKDILIYVKWACGPVCSQEITYFSYKDNEFKEFQAEELMSKSLLQKIKLKDDDVIKFAQEGLTSKVVTLNDVSDEKLKFTFKWNKNKSQFE